MTINSLEWRQWPLIHVSSLLWAGKVLYSNSYDYPSFNVHHVHGITVVGKDYQLRMDKERLIDPGKDTAVKMWLDAFDINMVDNTRPFYMFKGVLDRDEPEYWSLLMFLERA